SSYAIHLEPVPGYISEEAPAKPTISNGSAFHCFRHGYFVTNYHVVEKATSIRLSKGSHKCTATLAGTDKANDLAVLIVTNECLGTLDLAEPLGLGKTKDLQQGQDIVTYGYPLPSEFAGEPQ